MTFSTGLKRAAFGHPLSLSGVPGAPSRPLPGPLRSPGMSRGLVKPVLIQHNEPPKGL